MKNKCTSRNGTYACQFVHGPGTRHAGMHYAYFVRAGLAYIAEWVDSYGRVTVREAPVPESKKR